MSEPRKNPKTDKIGGIDVKRFSDDKETLAANIANVSDGMTALLRSGLNKKAIIILLQHNTSLSQGVIRQVLDALPVLKKEYTTL